MKDFLIIMFSANFIMFGVWFRTMEKNVCGWASINHPVFLQAAFWCCIHAAVMMDIMGQLR